jgi:hypothetical protein
MPEVIYAIIGAGVVGALSYLGSRLRTWYERHTKLGHLITFIGDSKHIKIVVSSLAVSSEADEFLRAQPANVLFSPTAEGAAIARLYLMLHEAKKDIRVEIQPAKDFNETGSEVPFISIGGPSVNMVSSHLIDRHVSGFHIEYPVHHVTIGEHPWNVPQQRAGLLTEDYGFLLSGRAPNGARFIVLWGIYAFGTLAAARALIDLSDRRKYQKEERAALNSEHGLFLAVHGKVEGYQLARDIGPVRPQPEARVHH